MSANGADDGEDIPGREIAYRLFAAEYDDASLSYAESDEERAPNYVVSPTGARINRIFAVGTLTEVTSVNDEMVRARVVDPTGAFVVYAGQYQPDELAFLERVEPPAFVAVTGKARTFEPEDGDRVYTSVRPESIAEVDAATRDRWVVSTAEQTLDRIGTYAEASAERRRGNSESSRPLEDEVFQDSADRRDAGGDALTDALSEADVEFGLAAGIPLAQDHYGTTPSYLSALRDCALEAVEVVANDRDEVSEFSLQPDQTGAEGDTATFESLAELADTDVDAELVDVESAEPADAGTDQQTEPVAATTEGDDLDGDDAGGEPVGTASATGTAAGSSDDGSDGDEPTEVAFDESESEAATDAETATEPTTSASGSDDSDDGNDGNDESEPQTEPAESEPAALDDDPETQVDDDADEPEQLGDFDADAGSDADAGAADDAGMYEMDDEEREQVEEEFGTEFTTGAEVDEPGEADIDVPEADAESAEDDPAADGDDAATSDDATDDLGSPPESNLEAEADEEETVDEIDETDQIDEDIEAESEAEGESEGEDEDATDSEPDESEAETAAVDLQDTVVDTMEELDDGDGADRTALVETVAADTGASEADVEDAIEDALMGGQCYEPDDETLKAI